MNCPHYERIQRPLARKLVSGYCQDPTAGIMVPSLMEEKSYCLRTNGHLKCPIYRASYPSRLPRELSPDSAGESICYA